MRPNGLALNLSSLVNHLPLEQVLYLWPTNKQAHSFVDRWVKRREEEGPEPGTPISASRLTISSPTIHQKVGAGVVSG